VRQRFNGQHVADVLTPGAAICLLDRDPQQPEHRSLLHQRAGEDRLLVERGGVRRHAVRRELCDLLLEGFLIVGELEMHAGRIVL
jgi:hypothetical protein